MTTKYSIIHTTFILTGRKKVSKKLMKSLAKNHLHLMLFSLGKTAFSFVRNDSVTNDRESITKEIASFLDDNGYEFRLVYYSDKQFELTNVAYNKALIDKYTFEVLNKTNLKYAFFYKNWADQNCIIPLTSKQFAFGSKIKNFLGIE